MSEKDNSEFFDAYCKAFEEYCEENNKDYGCQSSWEEKIFNDQQKKLDQTEARVRELEKENKFQAEVICDMGEVVLENKALTKERDELVGVLRQLDKDSLIPFHSRRLIYEALQKLKRGKE